MTANAKTFQQGQPKVPGSGRKVGTPNKRQTLDVHGKLAEGNVDLVAEILEDIKLILDPVERTAAKLKLLEYCAPKLKAVELTDGHNMHAEKDAKILALPRQSLYAFVREKDPS